MASSPKYKFNKSPRFSVNLISEYLATTNATQRTKIIQSAKFPKKVEVAAYGQIRKPLQQALGAPNYGHDDLNFLRAKLDAKAEHETGYARDEALRCVKALGAFQETFLPRVLKDCTLTSGPSNVSLKIEGVNINTSLDASILHQKDEETSAGGIILIYAFSTESSALQERLATASNLILWTLESYQIRPAPKICIAAGLAERKLVKASSHHQRFRSRVIDSCKEISARWHLISPPQDYDGPDWK